MADAKITALTANTTPLSTDLLPIVDDPGGTPETQKATIGDVLATANNGWLSANETWTYASASTITVASGAASKYAVGDRIKWTQTTVKYGVITAVADTVLTIAVNTDYTVANAAISANYYSHESSPIGYPHLFAYASAWSGTGTPPAIGNGTVTSYFSVMGRNCFADIEILLGSSSTIGNGTYTFSAPITSAATIKNNGNLIAYYGSVLYNYACYLVANGSTIYGVVSSGAEMTYTSFAQAAGNRIQISLVYKI